MKKNVCCIFNIGPHYRASIYELMDKELQCDFYFGDKADNPIKLFNYNQLKGFQEILPIKRIPKTGFEWQKGVWKLVFKPYKHYIITGTPGSLSNWMLVLLAIPLRKKVYAWTHGMKGNSTPIGKFIEKNFYRLCHKILLYGEFSRNIMLKEKFKNHKLVLIYNSLDYKKQLHIRSGLKSTSIYSDHFKNNNPVLVYIGRIQKSKKIDLLVKSMYLLSKRGVDCNLVIIGKDVEGNDIPQLVGDYGLKNNVWFYGPCYDEREIGNLLYNSDVCISPGLIGLTAIHSLTYGTPIITSNNFSRHGPEFEVIQIGVTGDFFNNNDTNDLSFKIKLWINLNEKKRQLIRQRAYKIIDEKYNPFYQIRVLKDLIKD